MHAPYAPSRIENQPIRAELCGDDTCTALGVTVHAYAPLLELCRRLVAAGHDPVLPLETYRGAILCLKIRSIGDGARLRIASHGVGFERLKECTGASPVAPNGPNASEVPPTKRSIGGSAA